MSSTQPQAKAGDVVTFITFADDGRFIAQVRGYVTPAGNPVNNAGLFSINGGVMKTDDPLMELLREIFEELGIDNVKPIYIGSVVDEEKGRTNHVYRVDGYDSLLARYVVNRTASALDAALEAIRILLYPEGLARAALWRDDLEAILAKDGLTGISKTIFEKFPEQLPPYRPKAAQDD